MPPYLYVPFDAPTEFRMLTDHFRLAQEISAFRD